MCSGVVSVAAFAVFTALVRSVDVQPVGQNGTDIGFASINRLFHSLTGVSMTLYSITDWLGLVPVLVCMLFGAVGLVQLVRRRGIARVDRDILLLGAYYAAVMLAYLAFEMIPINYRPIPINGFMEASYPSSTTLLVLSVMPTLVFQADRRLACSAVRRAVRILTAGFCVFMTAARLLSGVHWLTDIVGSLMLSGGLFWLYKAAVLLLCKGESKEDGI